MDATWSVWLINIGEPPLCWAANLDAHAAKMWCQYAADKVFDGSDADAFMLLRSDKHPNNLF